MIAAAADLVVARRGSIVRTSAWGLLLLAPATGIARYVLHAPAKLLFVLATAALVPLAWLIGESTDHLAQHTGSGVGGFLNASFGNAPELIVALFAVADGLPDVVRGAVTGSVVSNLLLVLGSAMLFGGKAELDLRSLGLQLAAVVGAVLLLLVPSVPGWHGSLARHSLYVLTVPSAAALLVAYLGITVHNLRTHRAAHLAEPSDAAWTLAGAVVWLSAATAGTALVSQILVQSLSAFTSAAGLSQFFVAAVIVAIVGNAAEHGGAVMIARRGGMELASEIAVTSALQVLLFVAPVVALTSGLVGSDLSLAFRPVELATIACAAVAAAAVVLVRRSSRTAGVALIGVYAAAVVSYYVSGNR